MSFINKVKNFFYEEVEDDEEYELNELRKREEKERKKEEKLREKQRKLEEKERIEKSRIEEPKIVEKNEDDLSERELFKSERTFNFPMDMGDEIFDDTEVMPIEEPKKEEPKFESRTSSNIYSTNVYSRKTSVSDRYENISKYQKEDPSEPKKFKPTPVVSPVYGILDKDYTVEDVVDKNLSKTKEFSLEKKVVDFDSVRNRAYKELDEEIEKTLSGTRDIFYNLDSEKEEEKESVIEDYSEPEYKLDEDDNDVVITYEGETEEADIPDVNEIKEEEEPEVTDEQAEDEDFDVPDVEIPIVKKRSSRKTKVVDEEPEEQEEKEDLFNLIDNMYKEDDEEEDE